MSGGSEPGTGRLKLAHAYELHQELRETVTEWIEAEPFKIHVKRKGGVDVGLLEIKRPALVLGDPFTDWALKLADVANNARAALDHEIYRLGLRDRRDGRSPDDPRVKGGFPVFTDAERYAQQGPSQYLVCVGDHARKVVEAEQPFRRSPMRPERDPLAELHWLNNAEKHRLTRAGFLLLEESVHNVSHFGPPETAVTTVLNQTPKGSVLADGAELFRMQSRVTYGDGTTSRLRGQLQLSLQPRFTELELPLERVDVVLRRVARIIDALEQSGP